MKALNKLCATITAAKVILCLLFAASAPQAMAFDSEDAILVDTPYTTHLFLHKTGHEVVAQDVGATISDAHMSFFAGKNGRFYPGLSTYQDIPEESQLGYAAGGERMAGNTFEHALQSYRHKPTAYRKAVLWFSCADFLAYTLLADYVNIDAKMYDPSLIWEEIGCSKEVLLSLVAAKSLLNAYRITNPDVNISPVIWTDNDGVALLLRIPF